MESFYLDTSALIKRYVEEEGTERVLGLTEDSTGVQVVILDITPLEARSALRRRQREGDISEADAYEILSQLEADVSSTYLVQPSTSAVIEEGIRLIDRHALRAYDALQLGGCLVTREQGAGLLTFVCADKRLCAAATQEGLAVLDPTSP